MRDEEILQRDEGGERQGNKKNNKNFTISICMLPNLRLHCSSMPNILTFKTPHVRCFLVFGMLKCQIFGI